MTTKKLETWRIFFLFQTRLKQFYSTSLEAGKVFCFAKFHLPVPDENWLYSVIGAKYDAKEEENVGFFSLDLLVFFFLRWKKNVAAERIFHFI